MGCDSTAGLVAVFSTGLFGGCSVISVLLRLVKSNVPAMLDDLVVWCMDIPIPVCDGESHFGSVP